MDYLDRNLRIDNFEKLKNALSNIRLVVDSFKTISICDVYTDRKSQKSVRAKKNVELVLTLFVNQNCTWY